MPAEQPPPEKPPETPPEPSPEEAGFRVMDLKFWAAIVFLVCCLIASGVVGFWGSKIWPRPHAHPAPAHAHAPVRAAPRP